MIGKPPYLFGSRPPAPSLERGAGGAWRAQALLSPGIAVDAECGLSGATRCRARGVNAVPFRADDPAEIALVGRDVEPLHSLQVDPTGLAAPHAPDLTGLPKLADRLL